MGFLGRWKIIHATYREWYAEARASVPQWARIVSVGRKFGPFVSLRLEIHFSDQPVHEVTTTVWLPRGVQPQPGQDVAYHISTGDDITHYAIDWHKPPQYGLWPDPNAMSENSGQQPLPSPRPRTPRQQATYQLLAAKKALDDGLITHAEFERVRDAWKTQAGGLRPHE